MTMATEKIRLTPEHTVFLAGHRGLGSAARSTARCAGAGTRPRRS